MDVSAENRAETLLVLISVGVAAMFVAVLASMFAGHAWVLDASGRPILTDFVASWSAGGLARGGHALSAYDFGLEHAAEAATTGHSGQHHVGWHYPPSFLLVAAGLASLPYAWAFALWLGSTLSLYAGAIAAISRRSPGAIVALAPLCVFVCAFMGQSGFLTAALVGLVLLTIDERPVVSGVLLGLLTFKPQFGLLFPLALAVSGRWRVFGWAAVAALGATGLSIAVFGLGVFSTFLHNLPLATRSLVEGGVVPWFDLESAYGLARSSGGSNAAAWGLQAIVSLACAGSILWLWRGRAPMDLKAASLPAAAILATPYVLGYDLPMLAVAAAFLYRHRRFDALECLVLAMSALTGNLGPFVELPLGFFSGLAIAALVVRRLLRGRVCAFRLAASPSTEGAAAARAAS